MDLYADHSPSLVAPASAGAAVSPSDASDLAQTSRAIYVGQGGDVALRLASGDEVTLEGVPSGTVLPLRARRVRATGTTASGLVALW